MMKGLLVPTPSPLPPKAIPFFLGNTGKCPSRRGLCGGRGWDAENFSDSEVGNEQPEQGEHHQLLKVCAHHPQWRSRRASICLPHRGREASRCLRLALGFLWHKTTEDKKEKGESGRQGSKTLVMFSGSPSCPPLEGQHWMLNLSDMNGQELCPQSSISFWVPGNPRLGCH